MSNMRTVLLLVSAVVVAASSSMLSELLTTSEEESRLSLAEAQLALAEDAKLVQSRLDALDPGWAGFFTSFVSENPARLVIALINEKLKLLKQPAPGTAAFSKEEELVNKLSAAGVPASLARLNEFVNLLLSLSRTLSELLGQSAKLENPISRSLKLADKVESSLKYFETKNLSASAKDAQLLNAMKLLEEAQGKAQDMAAVNQAAEHWANLVKDHAFERQNLESPSVLAAKLVAEKIFGEKKFRVFLRTQLPSVEGVENWTIDDLEINEDLTESIRALTSESPAQVTPDSASLDLQNDQLIFNRAQVLLTKYLLNLDAGKVIPFYPWYTARLNELISNQELREKISTALSNLDSLIKARVHSVRKRELFRSSAPFENVDEIRKLRDISYLVSAARKDSELNRANVSMEKLDSIENDWKDFAIYVKKIKRLANTQARDRSAGLRPEDLALARKKLKDRAPRRSPNTASSDSEVVREKNEDDEKERKIEGGESVREEPRRQGVNEEKRGPEEDYDGEDQVDDISRKATRIDQSRGRYEDDEEDDYES